MTCRLSIVKQDIVHDSMPISMPTTWVVTTCSGIGEEDSDIIVALSHRRRPLLAQEHLQGRASTGKTAQSGRARTHFGSAVFPARARRCNKPHGRFQS